MTSLNIRPAHHASKYAITLIACMTLSSAWAEIAQNDKAIEDAKYPCDTSGNANALLARGRALGVHVYDKNQLACAADLMTQAAQHSAPDLKLLTEALAAIDEYIEQVSAERDVDPVGVQTAEWDARLDHAKGQVDALVKIAETKFPGDPGVAALRIKADLLLHRADDPKDWVAVARRSITELNKLVDAAPNVLNGAPLVILGKLYLDLPPLFGGSPSKAVDLLERARSVDPNDSRRLGYLALAYAQVDRDADAKAVLTQLLAIEPQPATRQYVADSTIVGIGLATRFHDDALRSSFQAKRSALFAKSPELRPHVFVAVDGHGGENPLTGERQY
jgi:tetratricopeptide (TPR) repeat protein